MICSKQYEKKKNAKRNVLTYLKVSLNLEFPWILGNFICEFCSTILSEMARIFGWLDPWKSRFYLVTSLTRNSSQFTLSSIRENFIAERSLLQLLVFSSSKSTWFGFGACCSWWWIESGLKITPMNAQPDLAFMLTQCNVTDIMSAKMER